ncbi:PqqD family protein [Infirmifilum sp. NZ]|uniref:PqqD family protein n=1 Tax=Infirmifilum sp. NZ TaxID=2926850 RepID=UPI0027A35BFE|nr:PqqD family protein [Infirmifilum sp. NZ]UNQ73921.1 PqqD family protein [Infirmifilum sp. NZ]
MKPIFLAKKVRKENSIIGDGHFVASFLDFRGGIHYVNETSFKILSLCDGEKTVKEILETIEGEYLLKHSESIAGVYNVLLEGLRRGFLTNDGKRFKGFKPEIEGDLHVKHY